MKAICETCGKIFSKATKALAVQALRMHTARVHGSMQMTPEQIAAITEKRKATMARKREGAATDVAVDGSETKKQRQRRYQKLYRAKVARRLEESREQQAIGSSVCRFCPRCGLNLESLTTALTVVTRT